MHEKWIAWAWGCSLLMVWMLIALQLDQSLLQAQLPEDLVSFGAFKGRELLVGEPWRLVTAQWLNGSFSRMLFHAVLLAVVGGAIAERTSVKAMLIIGIGGGVVGLFVGALAHPEVIRFGASQAQLALCGAAMVIFVRTQAIWWIALAGVFGSIAFDLFQSSQGAVQFGYLFGFAGGALLLAIGGANVDRKRNSAARL